MTSKNQSTQPGAVYEPMASGKGLPTSVDRAEVLQRQPPRLQEIQPEKPTIGVTFKIKIGPIEITIGPLGGATRWASKQLDVSIQVGTLLIIGGATMVAVVLLILVFEGG